MKKFYSIMTRKSIDYSELESATKSLIYDFHASPKEYIVNKVIELPFTEFDTFIQRIMADYYFIKENKNLGENEALLVKCKGAKDEEGILIVTAGFDYARYTGLIIQKKEFHKCSRCGTLFADHPAISRKDNKSLVCSQCGTEEALEVFQEYTRSKEFKKYLSDMQDNCNRLNVQMIIKSSEEDPNPIIINPVK